MRKLLLTPAILALGIALLPHSVHAQADPGKGLLGGTVGMPFFFTDYDIAFGKKPRIIGKFHFGYVFNEKFRLSIRGGYGWTGYSGVPAPFPLQGGGGSLDSTKVDQLTTVVPLVVSVLYTHKLNDSWTLFGGLGPGLYRWNILNDRRTVHDPVTFERFLTWDPGVSFELGGEYFIPANRNVSLEFMTSYNYMLSADEDRFPSGYNGNHSWLDVDIGVNVYFNLPGSEPEVSGVLGDDEFLDELDAEGEESDDTGAAGETEETPEGGSDSP